MRRVLLGLWLSLSLLKAETDTVDTSSFDTGFLYSANYKHTSIEEEGSAYMIDGDVGFFFEYDMFSLNLSLGMGSYSIDSQNIDDMVVYKYNSSLLYDISNRISLGAYYNKIYALSETDEYKAKWELDSGKMSAYGLQMVYNPNSRTTRNESELEYTFSIGYLNADNILSQRKRRGDNGWVIDKRQSDLSGYTFSIGIIFKKRVFSTIISNLHSN
jgi:hypothetical protein